MLIKIVILLLIEVLSLPFGIAALAKSDKEKEQT